MDVAELSMFLDTLGMGKGAHSDAEFVAAQNTVKNMKDLDDAQRLQLYGLYKQATVGDAWGSEPSALDMVATAKWNAWKGFAGMPQQNAVLSYVYIVSTLMNPDTANTMNFGNIPVMEGMGNIVSTLNSGEATVWSDAHAIFRAIEGEDINELRKCLHLTDTTEINDKNDNADNGSNDASDIKNGILADDEKKNILPPEDENVLLERRNILSNTLSLRDSCGLTPLLYAADRGILEIVELLLSSGADINATDSDGNTALMLSVICEHNDIIELLVSKGADLTIENNSGENVLNMGGVSESIRLVISKNSVSKEEM